ncbi:MAG TPA: hypothetical protein VJG30_05065 [Candidatus Nanoarchaeia archaeon]|nr:hypothetical protein [Candidatus Nanoarchaeia archaeon]
MTDEFYCANLGANGGYALELFEYGRRSVLQPDLPLSELPSQIEGLIRGGYTIHYNLPTREDSKMRKCNPKKFDADELRVILQGLRDPKAIIDCKKALYEMAFESGSEG